MTRDDRFIRFLATRCAEAPTSAVYRRRGNSTPELERLCREIAIYRGYREWALKEGLRGAAEAYAQHLDTLHRRRNALLDEQTKLGSAPDSTKAK
jgi:hypothetical protein